MSRTRNRTPSGPSGGVGLALSVALSVAVAAPATLGCARRGVEEPAPPSPPPQLSAEVAPEPAPVEPEPPPAPAPPPPPERVWGRADLDPSNDATVGPPDPVPDCAARLTEAGVTSRPAELPLTTDDRQRFTCGSHGAVVYVQGPTSLRIVPSPIVDCQLALALARFEVILQEEAVRHLGVKVRTVQQIGTYNCRRMARYDWVSEHSYGNAIDIESFTLENWATVTVVGSFGKGPETPARPEGRFLREVAHRLYDEDVFSVVLTPHFDALHHNHFHLDMARYRRDGSRP